MIEKKIDYNRVLTFLEHRGSQVPPNLEAMIHEAISETKQLAGIKTCYLETERNGKPVILFAATLGCDIERRILYYEKIYITRAMMMDAAANVLMESVIEKCTEQLRLQYQDVGYTLLPLQCPGNQGISIELNSEVIKMLDASKRIGLHITAHGNLLPQKSVVGIFEMTTDGGIACRDKCESCKLKCKYRKRKESDD